MLLFAAEVDTVKGYVTVSGLIYPGVFLHRDTHLVRTIRRYRLLPAKTDTIDRYVSCSE